jgi:hypothetical protein
VEIMEERLPMVFCTIFLAMISIETDHLVCENLLNICCEGFLDCDYV